MDSTTRAGQPPYLCEDRLNPPHLRPCAPGRAAQARTAETPHETGRHRRARPLDLRLNDRSGLQGLLAVEHRMSCGGSAAKTPVRAHQPASSTHSPVLRSDQGETQGEGVDALLESLVFSETLKPVAASDLPRRDRKGAPDGHHPQRARCRRQRVRTGSLQKACYVRVRYFLKPKFLILDSAAYFAAREAECPI